MSRRGWVGSVVLVVIVAGIASGLAAWKYVAAQEAAQASQSHPEPMESVNVALAGEREHVHTTTSIGTVMALRSITLRNELAGTVREVKLEPGQVVEADTLLVALDVSVEEAELEAQEAQAALAQTQLARMQRASESRGASASDVDRARAEHDVALAHIARTKALIDQKTLRAPFRARVGMANVHPGQYLNEGTELTTLQGVDDAVHVDFAVPQTVAAGLRVGDEVNVFAINATQPTVARIAAVDARVDPATRSAMVRARLEGAHVPAPGSSVRVRVPNGEVRTAVSIPVSALRRAPSGDHVFVIEPDADGKPRAHVRQVVTGALLGDEVLIYSGVSIGEQVATSGSFKLREGVLVAIAPDAAPSTSSDSAPSATLDGASDTASDSR